MDNSFGAAMAGLVIEDASRMSGARFADARGTGVVRRVRTRRRVRAAGMGGASAVAVGALAFGATHLPWGVLDAAPGIGGTDCVTPSPSDDAYAYEVLVKKGDTPGYTASLTDAATGAAFLTATLQPDGKYVFTDVEGNPLKATAEETSFATNVDGNPLKSAADELYEGYWVRGAQAPPEGLGTAPPGAAEILVKSISTADFVGLPSAVASAWDDCYTPSPTPSSVPSASPEPSRSSEPSLSPSLGARQKEAPGAQFANVNGRWCPTSPPSWGEPCVTVALPQVIYDGFPAEPEYVWLSGFADSIDPTVLTLADYAPPPNTGECWTESVDGYPSMSGAAFIYCPASALAGRAGIDDPGVAADGWLSPGEAVPDYRSQDRLYITQEVTPYPMVRADA